VPVDYGGHPCSFYLNDTYKLKQLVSEIAFDQFDVDRFYAVVREKTPDTYYPHYHESVACAEAGDIRGAIRSIRTAVSCKPSNARLHARHAELLLKNKDSALARTAFETAIQLEPKDAHYRVRLSHACAALNDWPEAVHQMEIAVSLNKMKYEYHARLSECLIKAGALAKAEASMAEAVRLAPEAENPRLRLAAIRRRLAIYSRLGLT
jgi:Flp pilus assembly protein TadD